MKRIDKTKLAILAPVLLTCAFAALKIFSLIAWSWWWVFSPSLALAGLVAFVYLGGLLFAGVVAWACGGVAKKPCRQCYPGHGSVDNYCGNCGRDLRNR